MLKEKQKTERHARHRESRYKGPEVGNNKFIVIGVTSEARQKIRLEIMTGLLGLH